MVKNMWEREFDDYLNSLSKEEKAIYQEEVYEWNKRDKFLNTIASERIIACYHEEKCIDFIRKAEKKLIDNNLNKNFNLDNLNIRRVNVYDISEEKLKEYILFLQKELEKVAKG